MGCQAPISLPRSLSQDQSYTRSVSIGRRSDDSQNRQIVERGHESRETGNQDSLCRRDQQQCSSIEVGKTVGIYLMP